MTSYGHEQYGNDLMLGLVLGDDAAMARVSAYLNGGGHDFAPATGGEKACRNCTLVIDVDTALRAAEPCPGRSE